MIAARVLDASEGVAAPYCAKLLADFGADVIKVERPGSGDATRGRGPFPGDVPDREKSGLFLWLNMNKRGVTIDLEQDRGRAIFRSLVEQVDIVVNGYPHSYLSRLGLDYDALAKRNSRLVMTSVTGFGLSGPNAEWKSAEIVAAATSSQMYIQGDPGHEPLKTAGMPFEHAAGVHAAIGTLAAIWARGDSGDGQHVDVSVQETAAHFTQMSTTWYTHLGAVQTRIGSRMPFGHPFTILPCADGYVAITHLPQPTEMLTVLTGIEAFRDDPRFATPLDRIANANAMDELLMQWTMQHTRDEIVRAGQDLRMAFDYVYAVDELVEDEQLVHRKYFARVDQPSVGTITVPRSPFGALAIDDLLPAPGLGQHNEEVFSEMCGMGAQELWELSSRKVI